MDLGLYFYDCMVVLLKEINLIFMLIFVSRAVSLQS